MCLKNLKNKTTVQTQKNLLKNFLLTQFLYGIQQQMNWLICQEQQPWMNPIYIFEVPLPVSAREKSHLINQLEFFNVCYK